MAEGLIQVQLSKLQIVSKDMISHNQQLQSKLAAMKKDMAEAKSFLDEAEAKAPTDPKVARWLHEVKEVAYETGDMLDTFLLGTSSSHTNHLLNIFIYLTLPLKHLREVHRISHRVDSIQRRLQTVLKDQKNYLSFILRSRTQNRSFQVEPLLIQKPPIVVGLDKPVQILKMNLKDGEPSLTVVTIVGAEGVGKTTLARQVYLHEKVQSLFECSAWINISQPILWEDLFRSMIVQFYMSALIETPTDLITMPEGALKSILTEFLHDKRYLLILDDVWSIDVWEYLKAALPNNKTSSRVLMSTRVVEVAYSCATNNTSVYIHRPMGHEQALQLFSKKMMELHTCTPSELSDSIGMLVKRCSQMPLAIVALAGLVSAKQQAGEDWLSLDKPLARQLEYEPVRRVLDLSFTNLPSILRSCIMYFGLFPVNFPVPKRRLFRLWMAEGFVEDADEATPEEVGEGYLNELVRRNLVQAVGTDLKGEPRSCCLHPLMHEVVASYFSRENFGAIFYGYNSYEMNKKTRRLSIHCQLETELDDTNASHISSFLMFSDQSIPASALQMICLEARLLRVLNLSNTKVEKLPHEIGSLVQLRYLSLRNTMVSYIPGCIGRLKLLETLDLKGTRVWKLPGKIAKLKALRYLAVYWPLDQGRKESAYDSRPKNGVKLPTGIDKLHNLQKLSLVNLSMDAKRNGQLEKLTQLRSLGVAGIGEANIKDLLENAIAKMKNLKSLAILSSETAPVNLPLSPHLNHLENLQLDGCSWNPIVTSKSLKKLVLRRNKLTSGSFKTIQNLPSLLSLELEEVSLSSEELFVQKGGFNELRILLLKGLSTLKEVKVEEEAIPNLQKLQIKQCTGLNSVNLPKEFICRLKKNGREDWRRLPTDVQLSSNKSGRAIKN